jgi:hypothetical protein
MLTTGFTIFLGVALILAKLPRISLLKLLKYDLLLDVAVSLITLMIHWGSMGGVLGATVAGLLTSLATSGLKKLIGYADGDNYYPGKIRLSV